MEQDIKTFLPVFTISGTVSENGVTVFDVVKRATAILQPVTGQEGLMLPVIKPREDTTENRDCLMIKFEEGDAAFSRCNTNTFEYAEVLGNNKLFQYGKCFFCYRMHCIHTGNSKHFAQFGGVGSVCKAVDV